MKQQVAIVTTTYNQEKYIGHTIESILGQTFSDWEMFIGDDNSSDETYTVALRYVEKNKNIHVRKNDPNLGIVGNMKFLLSQVSPDFTYIAFLEGDDMYTSHNLTEKINIFRTYPEVGLVYSDMSFIDKDNKIILQSVFGYRNVKFYHNQKIPKDEFILHKMGPISSRSTCMVRKEIMDKIGIEQIIDKRDAGDLHFYFQVATQYNVYGIDKPMTLYRRHQNNTSRPGGGITHHMEKQMDYYYKVGIISKEIYYRKLSWIYIMYSVLDLEQGEKKQALKHVSRSLSYSLYRDILYKASIIFLCFLPTLFLKKIMNFLIRRS